MMEDQISDSIAVSSSGSKGKGGTWSVDKVPDEGMDMEGNREKGLEKGKDKIPFAMLLLIAYRSLGVVYGDLSTSPLYVFSSTFPDGIRDTEDVVGAVSLIIYTLALIPLIKYVFIVLHANDNGEGGTFAIYSLICRHVKLQTIRNQHSTDRKLTTYLRRPLGKTSVASKFAASLQKSNLLQSILLVLVLLGTCMAVGDGILTPAISVLSSVNGIKVSHPSLSQDVVVILAVIILVGVFSMQHIGTHKVAVLFAPIVLVWLLSIGTIGLYNITKHYPRIFRALSPVYIVRYFKKNVRGKWDSLGGIVLAITGTEVMFADLGHFYPQSVQVAFTMLVFPCLLLIYLGQAAYLMKNPDQVAEAFYRSIPAPVHWPMIIVATLAAIVASQASISASFSIIKQAVALGCFPRVKIIHTSQKALGQVYIPDINWILMLLCLAITGGFKRISLIGNAYGIAVIAVMLVTTLLMAMIMLIVWQINIILILSFLLVFGSLEFLYFSSVLFKTDNGGWVPLAIASILLAIMYTWHYGTMKRHQYEVENRISLSWILGLGPSIGMVRVPGIGLFYTDLAHGVPPIFSHFITHLPAVHSVVVFICITYLPVHRIPLEERFLVRRIGPGNLYMFRCVARYGYMDLHKRDDDFEGKLIESLEALIRSGDDAPSESTEGTDPYLAAQRSILQAAEDNEDGSVSLTVSQVEQSPPPLPTTPHLQYHSTLTNYSSEIITATDSNNTTDTAVNQGSVDRRNLVTLRLRLSRASHGHGDEREEDGCGIEDQLQYVRNAKEVGIVHITEKTMIRARKESGTTKKMVVNCGYGFLQKICRDSSTTLNIPHETLLNVGMVYYV